MRHTERTVIGTARPIALGIASILLLGCTYHGQLKQSMLSDSTFLSEKSDERITLLDNGGEGIKNPEFNAASRTLTYSLKDSYFGAVKNTLQSVYSQVDVSSAKPNAGLYAVPYFESRLGYVSGPAAGIDTLARIDIFEGGSNQLLKSYPIKNHIDYQAPSSVFALGFLTGFTLFAISPITIPAATNIIGDHGGELLEKAIHESLTKIRSDLAHDQKAREEWLKIDKCFANLQSEPVLAPIADKIALDSTRSQTFEMLANKKAPSENEKAAIRQWREMRTLCWAKLEEFNQRTGAPPALAALYGSTKTAHDNLLVLLYDGTITYGEFAKKRQDITDAMTAAEAQIKAELAKETAEAQARAEQLALQAQQVNLQQIQTRQMEAQTVLMGIQTINQQQQTLNQQRLINQLSQPRSTNCNAFGNTVNCTTW